MKLSPRYDGPPILSFDGPAGDQSVPVARQRRRMEAMLADLSHDEWCAASRCVGWTAQDVVSHIIGVNAFWEASVRAGLEGTPTRVLGTYDPAAHPPLMVDGMRALSPHEVFDQFVESNRGFLGALASLDDQGWSTLAETPAGHVTIRLLAAHALWDAWIHERDIALPLGRVAVEEADEVRSCLRYAAALGPALGMGHDSSPVGEFAVASSDPDTAFTLKVGEAVDVYDDRSSTAPCLRGDSVELVEALSLRAPLPVDTPVEWYRVLNGLAKVFDSELS